MADADGTRGAGGQAGRRLNAASLQYVLLAIKEVEDKHARRDAEAKR